VSPSPGAADWHDPLPEALASYIEAGGMNQAPLLLRGRSASNRLRRLVACQPGGAPVSRATATQSSGPLVARAAASAGALRCFKRFLARRVWRLLCAPIPEGLDPLIDKLHDCDKTATSGGHLT
jgi:hypothetical protein